MILHFNYEELTALRSGARVFLEREEPGRGVVLAPAAERDRVEALLPKLDGDISLSTLAEVRSVEAAVRVIVECLGEMASEMETLIELVSGTSPTAEAVTSFQFPD